MSTPTNQQQPKFSIFASPSDSALGRSPQSSSSTPRTGGVSPRNNFSVRNTRQSAVGGGTGRPITSTPPSGARHAAAAGMFSTTRSPPQATPPTLDLGDRFIASVEPGAFNGPDSPQVLLAPIPGSGSTTANSIAFNNNRRNPFGGGRGPGGEDGGGDGDPSLSGLAGTTREALGADEESRSQYRRALRDTMGVGSHVMRYSPYSSPPQHHPTTSPPPGPSASSAAAASSSFGAWTPTSTPVPAAGEGVSLPYPHSTTPQGSFGVPSDVFTSFSAGGGAAGLSGMKNSHANSSKLFQSSSDSNLLFGGPLAVVSGGFSTGGGGIGVEDFSPQTMAEASPGEDFSQSPQRGGGAGYSTPRKTEPVPTAGGGVFASLCSTPPHRTPSPPLNSSYALDTPTRRRGPIGGTPTAVLDSTTNSELNKTTASLQNYFEGGSIATTTIPYHDSSTTAGGTGATTTTSPSSILRRKFGTPLESHPLMTGRGGGPLSTPTPTGFMTPVVEDQRLPVTGSATPGTSPQQQGSSSSGGAFGSSLGGRGGTTPGAATNRFSPAISLTSTPSRTEATYHKRRRRLDGSTPVRILNAEGIIDQVGCSALSWTESALFIALRNTLYAWTKDSVDVAFEIPEPTITCVAASDVPQTTASSPRLPSDASVNAPDDRPATYVALGTENGLVHVIRMVQIGVPLQPNFVEDPDTGNLIPADTAANRIQWHFMITEHMTQCTAADITGDKLATGSAEGVLIITDLKSQTPLHRLTLSSSALTIQFSPRDAAHLAVGLEKGVTFFRTSDVVEPTNIDTDGPVKCISWNPHTLVSVLTYSVGSTVFSYSPGSGLRGCKEVKAPITSLCWSLRAPELVVGHGTTASNVILSGGVVEGDAALQNSVSIYDGSETELSETNPLAKLRLCSVISGHRSPPFHLAVEPINGACVVSGAGGVDNTLRFWNLYPENMDDKKHTTRSPGGAARTGETVHFGGRGGADEGGVELFPSSRQQQQQGRGVSPGNTTTTTSGGGPSYFDPFSELR